MADTHTPPNFAGRLLDLLGAKSTYRKLIQAWCKAEGGLAKWNPMNTTYDLPGATDYNSVGVKDYAKPLDGICATALTLANGYYDGLLGALQGGKLTAEEVVTTYSAEIQKWGTNPQVILEVLKEG